MLIVDIRIQLNNLRLHMLASKVRAHGSDTIVVYASELQALDKAIEILKEIED